MGKKYYGAKSDSADHVDESPRALFRYVCPACTNTAVETSNKMLGVSVPCQHCGQIVKLDNEQNYIPL